MISYIPKEEGVASRGDNILGPLTEGLEVWNSGNIYLAHTSPGFDLQHCKK